MFGACVKLLGSLGGYFMGISFSADDQSVTMVVIYSEYVLFKDDIRGIFLR